jgi:hypothetical protein
VDVGATIEEQRHHVRRSADDRTVQRMTASAVDVVHERWLPIEKGSYARQVAGFGGIMDRMILGRSRRHEPPRRIDHERGIILSAAHNGRTILSNQEAFMRRHMFTVAVLFVVSTGTGSAVLSAAGNPVTAGQAGRTDAQKYLGALAGFYTSEGGDTNKVSFTLKKDEKGQWGGTAKWVNQEGEQTADFKSLQIADGKMKGTVESPDGQVDITIEGHLEGDHLEGTYAVSPKGSAEVAERGTWKVTKNAAPQA